MGLWGFCAKVLDLNSTKGFFKRHHMDMDLPRETVIEADSCMADCWEDPEALWEHISEKLMHTYGCPATSFEYEMLEDGSLRLYDIQWSVR